MQKVHEATRVKGLADEGFVADCLAQARWVGS